MRTITIKDERIPIFLIAAIVAVAVAHFARMLAKPKMPRIRLSQRLQYDSSKQHLLKM
jgi:hypothetical protein